MPVSAYALAVTVHDPEERWLRRFHPALSGLVALYGDKAAACTDISSERTRQALADAGFEVAISPSGQIGQARRDALATVLRRTSAVWIHYADLDRLLHWYQAFPEELKGVLASGPCADYVALGRTQRALDTHPTVQILAETLTNTAFSALLRLNRRVDVVAGSCLLSRRAAGVVVRHSREPSNATDLEWPALVLRELGVMPEFRHVEGLEFETADYYAEEIQDAGSLQAWMYTTYNRSAVWIERTKLALDSIAALARVLSR